MQRLIDVIDLNRSLNLIDDSSMTLSSFKKCEGVGLTGVNVKYLHRQKSHGCENISFLTSSNTGARIAGKDCVLVGAWPQPSGKGFTPEDNVDISD